ncbi:MAG TPA: HD domain-containing protein [Abditibacterium sp.]|jgi:putative hydrolase of HD superfamily
MNRNLPPQTSARLQSQIQFLLEADRLKSIARRTYLGDESRRENSAEHSWHLALGILLLREYSGDLDVFRALQMAILHDLVEIDAGDTFVYDDANMELKTARERVAAERIFGLLPADQNAQFRAVWEEFERGESAEAKFALAIDRLCPILMNYATAGRAWNEHGVGAQRVRDYNLAATEGAPEIQRFIGELLDLAEETGIFREQA